MKTLSINPFHLKPVLKRGFRRPKEVKIPPIMNLNIYDKLMSMQNSLNYMATNYGINFVITTPKDNEVHLNCYSDKHFSEGECFIKSCDDNAEVARKIYEAASKAL